MPVEGAGGTTVLFLFYVFRHNVYVLLFMSELVIVVV